MYTGKNGGWIITVDRNAGNRGASACKSPNKCSYKCKGTGGWSLNPNQSKEFMKLFIKSELTISGL